MSINELLATLKALDIQLAVKDGQLAVQGNRRALSDNGLVDHLRSHKTALIELLEQGLYTHGRRGMPTLPANGIAVGCTRITPEMLTLVDLDQAAIERLTDLIPGGAANVQDIYPLAPLQEGILYHHVSASGRDPYVMRVDFALADQQRLDAFVQALQAVIDRHDILRSSVHWQGLEQPVQVVWRSARLNIDNRADSPDAEQPGLDLGQAPLLRLVCGGADDGRVRASLLYHHIALDHSALEVVRQEIHACLLGQGATLGTPVPFRNYVGQALLGVSEAEHEAFFRGMLGDVVEPTLAYDLQDLSGDGEHASEHSITLDPAFCLRLRAQARTLGVSVASLFHLGWAHVLAGLTGRQRVVFGTVLMGRLLGAEATERALGIFINTLPLCLSLEAQEVSSAIRTTHQRLTTLMRHEHAPLALAQRCSGVAAPTPLFNALLNYRHSSPEHGSGELWQGIEVLQARERSNYPVVMSVDDLGEAFAFTAQTAAGVDPLRTCRYLQRAMEQMLDALEQVPAACFERVDILPDDERIQLLQHFAGSRSPYESLHTVHWRIERQALERPGAVAAAVGEQALSYAELNAQANGLAHRLIALGVRPDDRVAVVARRGLDTLVGLLAVLKAGAGYVPVDPAHPDERIAYLLSDSAPVAVLSQQGLIERLPALETPVVLLDQPSWSAREDNPQVPGLNARHLAYVIYTSGSTGQPKGVMVEHQSLNNLVDWHCQAFDLKAGSHTASVAGFGFDAMAWEVWPAFCAGATLHLPPAHIGNEQLDALLDWWQAQPLQVAFLPTPVAEYAFSRELRHPTLRTLLIGGDRLRQFPRDPGFAVVNNYGPTEATVVASSGVMAPGGVLHIGKPVFHARLYVLDARCQPVPVGVPGELYIGGAGVARGYLNRAELTAERFLADPFVTQPDARMYRSGDLVRWLDDGTLDYLGRNDDQVKIRGVRIELGEIEQHLAQCPGIGEAVVVTQQMEDDAVRLIAYFTRRDPALEGSAIRSHLLERLPEYMVPAFYMGLDAMPLTQNGKVDRRALPELAAGNATTGGYEAPGSALEQRLAELWTQVLEVGPVGRRDNFFELGGHSLSAIRLVSLMQDAGLPVTLAELFQRPDIAALAELLQQRPAAVSVRELIEVRAGGDEPALFLFHDFTGLDAYFPVLGQHLGGEFPIYGLPGIALGAPQLNTIECLAARFIELMRSVQPRGPYRVAGWSFGGVLAYEVASQLAGMDEEVGFVGLIDSYIPRLTDQGKARWQGPDALQRHLLAHCQAHWQAQGETGAAAQVRLAAWQARAVLPAFDELLQACRHEQLLYDELAQASDRDLRHFLAREVAHGHALAHYQLQPLALPVHLFCAEQREQAPAQASACNGWETVLPAPYLQRLSVPGDHMSLMRAPHVAVLAQVLGDALRGASQQRPDSEPHATLLAIQSGKAERTPLFCVPGAGDSVTSFIGLAEALGGDWPIHGLQARGLDGRSLPHSRVEAAARHYLAALEAHYPQGPLHLVGHSFGGWVAHALACQLEAKGRQVSSLTLIDSEAPDDDARYSKAYTSTAVLERLIEALQLSSGKSLGLCTQAFASHDDSTQMRLLEEAMVGVGLLPSRFAAQALQGIVRTFGSALRSAYRPQPGGYGGAVNLVQVADPSLDALANRLAQAGAAAAWGQLLPQLSLWHGPGDHFSILKAPDAYSLAAWWYETQASGIEEALS